MYCKEGYCPFVNRFPKDCPGEICWLRKMQREGADGIVFSTLQNAAQPRRIARRRAWLARSGARQVIRQPGNSRLGAA